MIVQGSTSKDDLIYSTNEARMEWVMRGSLTGGLDAGQKLARMSHDLASYTLHRRQRRADTRVRATRGVRVIIFRGADVPVRAHESELRARVIIHCHAPADALRARGPTTHIKKDHRGTEETCRNQLAK
jgi:hypothetical protein